MQFSSQTNIIFFNPTFIVSSHAGGLRIVPHGRPHEVQVPLLYFQAHATYFPSIAQHVLFQLALLVLSLRQEHNKYLVLTDRVTLLPPFTLHTHIPIIPPPLILP